MAESMLLKKYEKAICNKAKFIAVSQKDVEAYKSMGCADIQYLPVFLPFEEVDSKTGRGDYCLYQGNLSVAENEKAAIWLMRRVFNDIDLPLMIAGKNPSEKIRDHAKEMSNVTLAANPSADNMEQLISRAQVNILPSFNTTGVKLKLLNALFVGRHCLVNTKGVEGSGAEPLCCIADDAATMKKMLKALYLKDFGADDIQLRKAFLKEHYNNAANTRQLMQWIW